MRRVRELLLAIALTACGAAPRDRDPLGVSDSEIGAATRPSQPRDGTFRIARLEGPTRPQTIATLDVDVGDLPVLKSVDIEKLPEEVRKGVGFDAGMSFSGLEGLDIEAGTGRWLVRRGARATGSKSFRDVPTSAFVSWRGHMARGLQGRLRFLCFEGSFDGQRATISAAYEVQAEPIFPGVLWAFRSGRADFRAPAPLVGAKGQPLVSPDPCSGVERVEFVGPPPMWMIGPSADPRDSVGFRCARGACPFSRVALPILPGEVTTGLIVSDDERQRGQFDGVPHHSNVFSYTMEIDASGAGPTGRVFVGAEQAAASTIFPEFGP